MAINARLQPAFPRWRCSSMRPKHKQFDTQYASIFGDASVVDAYQYRPPYSPEIFDILLSLLDADASPRTVLDAGCGPALCRLDPWRDTKMQERITIDPNIHF